MYIEGLLYWSYKFKVLGLNMDRPRPLSMNNLTLCRYIDSKCQEFPFQVIDSTLDC